MAEEFQYPEWNQPGVEPPQAKKDEGWLPTEKPPAEWFNWFFNRTYQALKYINDAKIGKYDKAYWQKNAVYEVGDICYPSKAKSYKYMECMIGGIAGETEPAWSVVGTMITDGTVKWRVCDIRAGSIITAATEDYTGKLRVANVATKNQRYLTDMGLPGDGVFHSIASLFPNVTLAEVKALNPDATLANSADWYIIQKLTNELDKHSTIFLDGYFRIDLPVVIKREHLIYAGVYDTTLIRNTGGLRSALYAQGNIETAFLLAGVPGQYGQYNIYFRDFYIVADGDVKPQYGVKTMTTLSGSEEVNGLFFKNCRINFFAHSGLYLGSGVTFLRVDTCGFNSNGKNGIYGKHGDNGQKNDIKIKGCSFGSNGYDATRAASGLALTDITIGHGINLSGTSLAITESEFALNGNTGIFINSGPCSGVYTNGNYFEKNYLADVYISTGVAASYRHNLFISPSSYYEERSTPIGPEWLGRVYVESMGKAVRCIPDYNIDINATEIKDTDIALPIATYTHTGNTEIIVTAVDVGTSTFTAVGHGLANGILVAPVSNWSGGAIYPIDKYPGGLSQPMNGYYVGVVDANSFKLYTDAGLSTLVTLSANANIDLATWHFETVPSASIVITGLGTRSKCKLVIKSKNLIKSSPVYVWTGGTGVSQTYMKTPTALGAATASTYAYASLGLNGDLFNYAEIFFDNTQYNTFAVKSTIARSNTTTANYVTNSNDTYVDMSYTHYNKPFTQVTVLSAALANGSKIEVYRA